MSSIYVINLKRAPERLLRLEQQFAKSGNTFTCVEAVDYKNNVGFENLRKTMSVYLQRGHAGCALSHILLLQQFIRDENSPYCIVLEDDAELLRKLPSSDSEISNVIRSVKHGLDMLYLTSSVSYDSEHRVIAGSGTYGYIITRKGAAKVLTITRHLSVPIDLRLIAHSPVCDCYKPQHLCPTHPELELESYASKTPYVAHKDCGFSYVNQSNKQ